MTATFYMQIQDALRPIEPQNDLLYRMPWVWIVVLGVLLSWLSVQAFLLILVGVAASADRWLALMPAQRTSYLLQGGLVCLPFSILVADFLVLGRVRRNYFPNIELQVGPNHTFTAQKKRRLLWYLAGSAGLGLLVNVAASYVFEFLPH